MTRGRQPLIALGEAIPIARKRGMVMRFCHDAEYPCDLLIFSAGRYSFVSVYRIRKLHTTVEDIRREYNWAIEKIRCITAVPCTVTRELWLCSYYGTWRFFRIEDTGLSEIQYESRPVELPLHEVSPGSAMVNSLGPG